MTLPNPTREEELIERLAEIAKDAMSCESLLLSGSVAREHAKDITAALDELAARASRIEELEKALGRAAKDLRYALDWGVNGGFNDEDESFLRQGLAALLSAHPDKEGSK